MPDTGFQMPGSINFGFWIADFGINFMVIKCKKINNHAKIAKKTKYIIH